MRKMASSTTPVLPLAVGAATTKFSSVSYAWEGQTRTRGTRQSCRPTPVRSKMPLRAPRSHQGEAVALDPVKVGPLIACLERVRQLLDGHQSVRDVYWRGSEGRSRGGRGQVGGGPSYWSQVDELKRSLLEGRRVVHWCRAWLQGKRRWRLRSTCARLLSLERHALDRGPKLAPDAVVLHRAGPLRISTSLAAGYACTGTAAR